MLAKRTKNGFINPLFVFYHSFITNSSAIAIIANRNLFNFLLKFSWEFCPIHRNLYIQLADDYIS